MCVTQDRQRAIADSGNEKSITTSAAKSSDDPAVRRRLASAGIPLPGIEIEIRDEDGRVLGPNERGEIYVRGEQVSGEYEGRGRVTDNDGWFPTRDAGSMDDDGYLFLEGRADDVIVRGGENLSPGEIEDVLMEHPAVRDVAVVAMPDEQWGEAVAAAVVVKPGQGVSAEELQIGVDGFAEYCRQNRLTINVSKTKIMIFGRGRIPSAHF